MNSASLSDGRGSAFAEVRKVRTPQGMVLGNSQAG